jgi:hypothetical protein
VTEYSEVAAAQLDELEAAGDDAFWNATLDACDLALNFPAEAQKRSTAVVTEDGAVVFRLPVAGFPPYKVFWSHAGDGPRIEAVFPHP